MNKIRKIIGRKLTEILKKKNCLFYFMKYPTDLEIMKIVREAIENFDQGAWEIEGYLYAQCLKSTQHLKGDVAEVGVYNGLSAKIIESFANGTNIFLFDTFTGIPSTVQKVDTLYWEGKYGDVNYNGMVNKFKDNPLVKISKGFFPKETGHVIEKNNFSFVHSDVNIYQSTKECLDFFYPKMVENGIVLVHNTIQAEGTRQALKEFSEENNTIAIRLPCNLSLLIKKEVEKIK